MYVLTVKNKFKEIRYFCTQTTSDKWYDCDSIQRAYKFKTKEEADTMRDKLNKISKGYGWFGLYRTTKL